MIWTILGISVAILAVFCITVAETLVGHPLFENLRPYSAIGLGIAGAILWFIGRALSARDASGEFASKRFILFDLRYWGPMFLAFGVITLFIRPLRMSPAEKPVQVAKAVAPKPPPPPAKKPEPPPVVKAPPVFPKMKMQGVIYREAQPFVILNGESYTVGDHVGGVVVRAIDRTSVMLELEGEVKVLTVN